MLIIYICRTFFKYYFLYIYKFYKFILYIYKFIMYILNIMKYGKLFKSIIKNYNYEFIDYNYLKKYILCDNFFDLLINHIKIFNNNYIQYHNQINYNTENNNIENNNTDNTKLYEYILINYLSINKLLKNVKRKI